VHAIYFNQGPGAHALVSTDQGLYKSSADFRNWQRVSVELKNSEEETREQSLEQFEIEELAMPTYFSSIIHLPDDGQFYTATPDGIFESSRDAISWKSLEGQNLPSRKINHIERSGRTFYAATNHGLYQWDPSKKIFQDISQGLVSKEVFSLAYSENGDYLLAATPKGVFKLSHPEILFEPMPRQPVSNLLKPADVLNQFSHEPTVLEIQKAAIQYAEVHPEKIKAWRKAAAAKALFPTLSVDKSMSADQNIDLDRGGTNDPDRFIEGPTEKSQDWSVGLNWDIGDLIWSTDQTSIDVRSRLMVELRDDVLNEVTHLYFERRRLQVEMLMSPPRDLPLQIEKELRLQELTAGIDALTGGYLSHMLQ
jgi:hypothetical protein